ncbi:hypothetical protein [Pseudodonghicola flavimaris]|uniref:Type IV pilus biogenesis protein PilP n=1 Tax=Pseudodonghicola flavimaris TaxID=3050036 RepID=A0ABT7F6T8_9RHOB|nr:hypothetical protein [Pseudodonghicola flavimaris]MDK3020318.1 hypothetical protein [Pseudodonghicola flavimaris]
MKPSFALSLSFEGISLLHRAAGGWHLVGEVALDVPDLAGALAELRDRAARLEPNGISCKLIIPNDQIRYMTIDTGAAEGDARRARVRIALDGATPYQVEDLAFDIAVEGPLTHVAAVARETLAEAEAFAVEHAFDPVSFVAIPGDQPFLGEPFFGAAEHAGARQVEPDGIAVVVTGSASLPEPAADPVPAPAPRAEEIAEQAPDTPAPETGSGTTPKTAPTMGPETGPETEPATDLKAETAPEDASVGFSSRRGKPSSETDGTATAPTPAPPVPTPTPKPVTGPAPRPLAAPPRTAATEPRPVAKPVAAPPPGVPRAPATAPKPQTDRPASAAAGLQSAISGLLSLRKPAKPATEAAAKPVAGPSAAGPVKPKGEAARQEAEALTVFGARKARRGKGKPRFLGLILTAVLLIFLIGIAAWASLFTEGGLTGLFGRDRETPSLSTVPGADLLPPPASAPEIGLDSPAGEMPLDGAGDTGATPGTEPPLTSALPPEAGDTVAALPPDPLADSAAASGPALTDTDSAVLEALRPEDGAGATADMLDPELAAEPDPETGTDLTQADDETFYAATGIWPTAPQEPETPALIGLSDLYVASIDRTDLSQDAVALPPAAGFDSDLSPTAVALPAAPGKNFELDDRGLVTATPEGAESPEGVVVFQGPPPVVPPALPDRLQAQAEAADEAQALRSHLAGFRPRPRPTDLVEQAERAQLGGRSRNELGRLRPNLRPASVERAATAAAEVASAAAAAAAAAAEAAAAEATGALTAEDLENATRRAVATALVPKTRPSNLDTSRSSSRASLGVPEAGTTAPATVAPKIPSSASVARQATVSNAINLRHINLIGIYGTAANRRALIRLPSGRYKKVKIGDSIDGGKVVAIGDSELRYVKGGRNVTLQIPKG